MRAIRCFVALLGLLAIGCTDAVMAPAPPPPPPEGKLYLRFETDNWAPVYRVDVGGGEPERVNQPYPLTAGVRVAPDSRTLAYIGWFQLVTHDLVTGVTRDLTTGEWVDHVPAWSPDSRSIAIARDPYLGKPYRLMAVNADGSGEREIFTMRSTDGVARLTWSADGRWVYAFMYGRIPSGVYRVRADGTSADMEYVVGGISYFEINPRTGQMAVLRRTDFDDSVEVALFDEATREFTRIGRIWTPPVGGCCTNELAWSPDDRYLAVMSFGFEWERLHVFDAVSRRQYSERSFSRTTRIYGFSWGRDPATLAP